MIRNLAYNHYASQLLQQIHVLVMGIDVLTNPYSQFLDFDDGCHPQFYEPNNVGITIFKRINWSAINDFVVDRLILASLRNFVKD